MTGRNVLIAVISMLLGIATSFAIAWIAIGMNYQHRPQHKSDWTISPKQFQHQFAYWNRSIAGLESLDVRFWESDLKYKANLLSARSSIKSLMPTWVTQPIPAWITQTLPELEGNAIGFRATLAGWPFAFLQHEQTYSTYNGDVSNYFFGTRQNHPIHGFDLIETIETSESRINFIAFAANSTLYAVMWYIAIALILFGTKQLPVAQYWRRSSGHCPMCNHDLDGFFLDGCTECGWQRDA